MKSPAGSAMWELAQRSLKMHTPDASTTDDQNGRLCIPNRAGRVAGSRGRGAPQSSDPGGVAGRCNKDGVARFSEYNFKNPARDSNPSLRFTGELLLDQTLRCRDKILL